MTSWCSSRRTGRRWRRSGGDLGVVLTLMNKPAKNITLDLQVVDANGAVVNVADGSGGQRPASCSSAFDDPAQSPITVKLIAVA